jgi:hypothetical protein
LERDKLVDAWAWLNGSSWTSAFANIQTIHDQEKLKDGVTKACVHVQDFQVVPGGGIAGWG